MFNCNQIHFGEKCPFQSEDFNQILFHKMATQNIDEVSRIPNESDTTFFLDNTNIV